MAAAQAQASHGAEEAEAEEKDKSAARRPEQASTARPRWLRNEQQEWRRRIQHLTPSWFSITMGTGIVSILLQTNPYATGWLRVVAAAVFGLNVLLFAAILAASLLRYALYPALFAVMLGHPSQSLFVGTLPMGFATIVNMFALVCVPRWGAGAAYAAWAMWWLDAALSVATCLVLPFLMYVSSARAYYV